MGWTRIDVQFNYARLDMSAGYIPRLRPLRRGQRSAAVVPVTDTLQLRCFAAVHLAHAAGVRRFSGDRQGRRHEDPGEQQDQ